MAQSPRPPTIGRPSDPQCSSGSTTAGQQASPPALPLASPPLLSVPPLVSVLVKTLSGGSSASRSTPTGGDQPMMLSMAAPKALDIVRAIRARHGLAVCGMMRSGPAVGAYAYSFPVKTISEFWSHSWSGNYRDKMMTLWLYYNGMPAAVAGILVCSLSGYLLDEENVGALLGMLASYVVALFWPSHRRVFLDKACICQDDDATKQDGIRSLGYILRQSTTMLCLLDETYLSRLWCAFEYASRLRMKDLGYPSNVVVMPTYYGYVACFVSASLFAFEWLRVAIRYLLSLAFGIPDGDGGFGGFIYLVYGASALLCCATLFTHRLTKRTRAFAVQREELKSFSVSSANCTCCQLNHKSPEGKDIPCDRVLIEHTIKTWFGDLKAFDDYVADHVGQQMPTGDMMLPYRYLVIACTPLLHRQIHRATERENPRHLDALIWGIYNMTVFGPLIWAIMFKVFSKITGRSHRCGTSACEAAVVGLACSLAVMAIYTVQTIIWVIPFLDFYQVIAVLSVLNGSLLLLLYDVPGKCFGRRANS